MEINPSAHRSAGRTNSSRVRSSETVQAPENIANPGLWRADNVGPGSRGVCLLALAYPGPDSRLTPWFLTSPPPHHPHRGAPNFLPDRGRAQGGWRRAGISWPPRHWLSSARSDKALTDRHQMLFQEAPGLARSFRFSTVGNREPGACRRHKHPVSGGGSRVQERQDPCVRNRVGADAAPAPTDPTP